MTERLSEPQRIEALYSEIDDFLLDATPGSAKLVATKDAVELEIAKFQRGAAINLSINGLTESVRAKWEVERWEAEGHLDAMGHRRMVNRAAIDQYDLFYDQAVQFATYIANVFHEQYKYGEMPFYSGGFFLLASFLDKRESQQ